MHALGVLPAAVSARVAVRPPASRARLARAPACRGAALRVRAAAAAEAMSLRTYELDKLTAAEAKALLARPRVDFTAILDTVRAARRRAAVDAAAAPHAHA
jgi:hypothetical protein